MDEERIRDKREEEMQARVKALGKKRLRALGVAAVFVVVFFVLIGGIHLEPASYQRALEKQITKAETLLEKAQIGENKGQYPKEAVEELTEQVEAARIVAEEGYYETWKEAYLALKEAISIFKQSKNKKNADTTDGTSSTEAQAGDESSEGNASDTAAGSGSEESLAGGTGDGTLSSDESAGTGSDGSAADGSAGSGSGSGDGTDSSSSDGSTGSGSGSSSSSSASGSGSSSSGSSSSSSASGSSSSSSSSAGGSGSSSSGSSSGSSGSSSSGTTEGNTITVYLTIECTTLTGDGLSNLVNASLARYVPEDGIILARTAYTCSADTNVFQVLYALCRNYDIQLEYQYTAAYGTYYIEGIQYLYEFSAGSYSGWLYRVNGVFPNYGCSAYTLSDGDEIVFSYTCNWGDVEGLWLQE